tara:strand:+ start:2869 stop:3255 length:387 start_codon:yes stop_codon:yes gene_type:complete
MVARGKAKKKGPRRKKAAIGILNVAESYFQGGLITKLAFNLNPIEFVLGDSGIMGVGSSGGTSLTELVKDPSRLDQVATRFTPEAVVMTGIKSAVGNWGFRTARRFLRKPISSVNRNIMGPMALGVKL